MAKVKETISRIMTTTRVADIMRRENLGEKIPLHEKLWFKNLPSVRKAGIPFAMTNAEVEEYLKCKLSVQYFAQTYCQIKREDGTIGHLTLRDYQKDIIDLYTNNRFAILMASRQTGKTVSAAIVILHYILFNNDKGVMIVANKSKTVKEIIRKIKDIYKLLPFYLKQGLINWNETSMAFENGCRIQSENRTKEPSIGFTVDFLYLDEFAKVPNNIIEPYYGAVVPTVSSIQNSKIVITSTPDGFNLFHKLLTDAEREEDDPLKGMYTSMRVYWWQVKGRRDTKLMPLAYKFREFGTTVEAVIAELVTMGYEMFEKVQDGKTYPMIKWREDNEHTNIQNIRTIRLASGVPLAELCMVTNWQEEETKLIGGEDAFKQEYDLQFITGNKLLFDSAQMERLQTQASKFDYIPLEAFDKKLHLPYNSLKWLTGHPEIFNIGEAKKYHIVAAVDLSEGLGQDYTILNLFRLIPKSKEIIERQQGKLANIYEYFQLEQIGMFRSNIYRIDEFASLFYMVMFELFDAEKCKVVLEYNTYGATLLSELPHVFSDQNDYSNAVFLRYKHRQEDEFPKVGIKVTKGDHEASKKQLISDFQAAVHKLCIILRHDININELRVFSRKDTPSGDFTFQSESGNDDTVMTNVTMATVFKHVHFKNMVDNYIQFNLPAELRQLIEGYVYKKDDASVDYKSTAGSYSKVYGGTRNGGNKKPTSPFGSPFGGGVAGPSPWKR